MTTRATTESTPPTPAETVPHRGALRHGRGLPPQPAQDTAQLPVADCTADGAGGLTFDVRLPEPAHEIPPAVRARALENAAVLLVRRGTDPLDNGDGTVRLPLTPVAPGGPLRAALPSTMSLPEGRWDAYLEGGCLDGAAGDEGPQRMRHGAHDLRSLTGRTPRHGRTWLGVRIPYAAVDGHLTVRAWLRWPHAEAGELHADEDGFVLEGRLYGAELGAEAALVAQLRDPAGAREPARVTVPVSRVEDESGAEGAAFTVRLRYADLAGHAALPWRLLLATGGDGDGGTEEAQPVRIARILDDVADKEHTYVYAPGRVGDGADALTVQPCYTADNDLALRVAEGAAGTV
ncbi:hypothetical protein [Streptomyces sp. ODS28]|uniref:hypothetical protein n=1 Tax=Streptomyces sp. ODS28 TaxID=3136688 RepID=UPI0031ED5BEF